MSKANLAPKGQELLINSGWLLALARDAWTLEGDRKSVIAMKLYIYKLKVVKPFDVWIWSLTT